MPRLDKKSCYDEVVSIGNNLLFVNKNDRKIMAGLREERVLVHFSESGGIERMLTTD